MSKSKSVIGKKFNRLTVIGEYSKNKRVIRHCLCDCGNETDVTLDKLVRGHTKSCGCLAKEVVGNQFRTHGMSKTRLFGIYTKMVRRCYVPEESCFKFYGAKGIKICDEWRNDRTKFFDWALSNGYHDDLSIDRINVYGDYEPSNCRWATAKEQTRNKRNNRYLTYQGKKQIISDWARELNINPTTLQNRLKRGWSVEKALSHPVHKEKRNRNAKGGDYNFCL